MIKVNENENSEFWEGLITWWESNHRSFPWRETKNSYFILISEILLQKTAAAPVIDVYRKVIQGYPNVDALAKADESHLTELISPIGLRKRSKKLIALAPEIVI